MPPDGYTSLTVSDDVFEQLVGVMAEYDCDSVADAVEIASTIALERDEAELAQILAILVDGSLDRYSPSHGDGEFYQQFRRSV